MPSNPASAEVEGAKVEGGFETIFGAILGVTGVTVALFGFLRKAPPPDPGAPKAAETGTAPTE